MHVVRLSVIVVAACAASSSTRPEMQPRGPVSAQQILERVAELYAGASAYYDRGRLTTTFSTGGSIEEKNEQSFETAFVRPSRFLFRFVELVPLRKQLVIWMEGDKVFMYWDVKPGVVQEDEILSTPLAAATGVSGGLAAWIPPLLVPQEWPSFARLLVDPQLERREAIANRPCWRIRARLKSDAITLWVDEETYLIRRIDQRGAIDVDGKRYDVHSTIAFEPKFARPRGEQLRGPDVTALRVEKRKRPPWLGVLFEPKSMRIAQVIDKSPAQLGGLQAGDEITAIDGAPVTAAEQVVRRIASDDIGRTVTIAAKRGGKDITLPIKLVARPSEDKLMHTSLLDKPAPAFTATMLNGPPVKLAELRGQVVLVEFWATWCGPCTIQFPHLDRWHKQYAHKGLRIIAMTSEEKQLVRDYVAAEKLQYPIALDPDDAIRRTYLAFGFPATVVIDKAGVVRYLQLGAGDPGELEAAITRLLK